MIRKYYDIDLVASGSDPLQSSKAGEIPEEFRQWLDKENPLQVHPAPDDYGYPNKVVMSISHGAAEKMAIAAYRHLKAQPSYPRSPWISVEAEIPEKNIMCWFVVAYKIGGVVELGYIDNDSNFVNDNGKKFRWPISLWMYAGKPDPPSKAPSETQPDPTHTAQ